MRRLDKVQANPLKSRGVKIRAAEAQSKIIKQARDPEIKRLRDQLIRATQAGDPAEAKRIEFRIKQYEKEYMEDYD